MMKKKFLTKNLEVRYFQITAELYWTPHIKHLSLQLAQYSRLLYRTRNLVPNHILLMLYYRLVLVEFNME